MEAPTVFTVLKTGYKPNVVVGIIEIDTTTRP
jgi:hypothetical protein